MSKQILLNPIISNLYSKKRKNNHVNNHVINQGDNE